MQHSLYGCLSFPIFHISKNHFQISSEWRPDREPSGPWNLIKIPNVALEAIRSGVSSMTTAGMVNATLLDYREFLREDIREMLDDLVVDKSKVDRAMADILKKCVGGEPSDIVCIGVDGRKDDTLSYQRDPLEPTVLRKTTAREYHLTVTNEMDGSSSYLTHLDIPDESKDNAVSNTTIQNEHHKWLYFKF